MTKTYCFYIIFEMKSLLVFLNHEEIVAKVLLGHTYWESILIQL